ncbi:hypothetical protein M0813_20623 [Anaeramoeba flamelloides]|uniref:MULE transposase domain-containing protein n=1 Tax=Anaeramoeba flamelloides TaxID=1746091 RepID=A0ABQ8YKC0_9EUKA|nr:hypothetical protein M0813_20623 [Anaeramoeba flamelloides]
MHINKQCMTLPTMGFFKFPQTLENFFQSLVNADNLTKVQLYGKYLEFYKKNDNMEYIPEKIAKGRIRRFYNGLHPKAINTSVHLINEKTIKSDQFLVLNTLRPFTCLSWSSPHMINILQTTKHMFVDGTFLSAPSPFTQLFTIAAWDKATQKYYICNYTLLQGKKAENYEFFFNNLKFIVPGLNPLLITSDFESEYCKRTNGYLEKNNRKLNEKINHRKPGLNSLIHILKKEEDQQAIKYYAKLFKETTKNKNYFYNEKDLEKRIQEEKQDWTRIVDKLRKKEYFPPQQEKTINYKTIINNYDVEDILITRKKFKNRPIKKKQTVKKNNLNKIKNSVKTKTKKKNKIGKKIQYSQKVAKNRPITKKQTVKKNNLNKIKNTVKTKTKKKNKVDKKIQYSQKVAKKRPITKKQTVKKNNLKKIKDNVKKKPI